MIYQGLDDEEFEHIEQVKQKEYDATVKRLQEDGDQIKTFRDAQALRVAEDQKEKPIKVGGRLGKARVGTQKKTSQLKMLSGIIKKKRKNVGDDAGAAGATAAAGGGSAGAGGVVAHVDATSESASKKAKTASKTARSVTTVTPTKVGDGDGDGDDSDDGGGGGGLVGYGDSDDSE